MNAIDLIRDALKMTDESTARLVQDMRAVPLTRPTSNGGNHPLWVLGHLAFIEGVLRQMIQGEANPVEHWAPMFAPGSQPVDAPGAYPPFDEVLRTLRSLRSRNLALLEEIGNAGLDRPPGRVPPGMEDAMRTIGHAFMLLALHQMVHYGQIADARRVAGYKPLM